MSDSSPNPFRRRRQFPRWLAMSALAFSGLLVTGTAAMGTARSLPSQILSLEPDPSTLLIPVLSPCAQRVMNA